MPPPSPYNLNRWIIAAGILMVVTGLLASRGRKPALEMEREPIAAPTEDARADSDADG